MLYKLNLKNSEKTVLIDGTSYNFILNNEYLQDIFFLQNLRMHSHGYVFFQRGWKLPSGKYKIETLYLAKIIANKFLVKPSDDRMMVRFKNGNKLDCRITNLEYSTFSNIVRNIRKTTNKTGYRGVVPLVNGFKAIIYIKRKPLVIGTFDTAKAAAEAYNQKSIELFGETKSLNKIRG